MVKKIILDNFEQNIEDNFEKLDQVMDMNQEILEIYKVAKMHFKRKISVTLRIHEIDLEAMRVKACKLGIPYQTYINMLIHKDAVSGI